MRQNTINRFRRKPNWQSEFSSGRQITYTAITKAPMLDLESPQSCNASSAHDHLSGATQKSAPESQQQSQHFFSYACSWEAYINGHVVTDTGRTFIKNLLAAIANTNAEEQEDSSEEDDTPEWCTKENHKVSMDFVQQTLNGIAARSEEDGCKGIGRHASIIRMGRQLWQTPSLTGEQQVGIRERFFDDGTFPLVTESKEAFAAKLKEEEARPAPFAHKTLPYIELSVTNYEERIDRWLAKLKQEEMIPAQEDLEVLQVIIERVKTEFELEKEGCDLPKAHPVRQAREEPLRGFIHGPPGTGKSRLIYWIRRLFMEALGWEHGVQFLCIAFQNKVAFAMEGKTLHTAGDIAVGGGDKKLDHTDVDVLFTKNQNVRWLLIDEIGMIGDYLLGAFEKHSSDAAVTGRYLRKPDKSRRPFGGYNLLTFGDLNQIPPIPSSSALFIPPKLGKSIQEEAALSLFWVTDKTQGINFFRELTQQKRVVDDPWYSSVLEECRAGSLTDESYNFLLGFPTEHAGSWPFYEKAKCQTALCKRLHIVWQQKKKDGAFWEEMQQMECIHCQAERDRRNRLIARNDPRVHQEPFASAHYMHKNNEPKFHALLLRAAEYAKAHRLHILWMKAEDEPENP